MQVLLPLIAAAITLSGSVLGGPPAPFIKCNTRLVAGNGVTTLAPAPTSTVTVRKTVTPVAVSTKTIVPKQVTLTNISPLIVTSTLQLATVTNDATVTQTNFAVSVPTTTVAFDTVT